jgi:hypothetical protein
MLFSPGLLPFFVNFKAFPNSAVVIKIVCHCINSFQIVVHLRVLCFIIFHSIEEICFLLYILEFCCLLYSLAHLF